MNDEPTRRRPEDTAGRAGGGTEDVEEDSKETRRKPAPSSPRESQGRLGGGTEDVDVEEQVPEEEVTGRFSEGLEQTPEDSPEKRHRPDFARGMEKEPRDKT